MKVMIEVDAPEGTTHYEIVDDDIEWLKQESDGWSCWRYGTGKWMLLPGWNFSEAIPVEVIE